MEYQTPQFFHLMDYADRAEGDIIDMVSGNPDWEPPEALRDGLREYADRDVDELQYAPSDGLQDLRKAIATRRNVDPGQVVVTNGAGEANYLGMARALERDAGDGVLLADPVYSYYPGKTQMLGGTERYVPVGPDGTLDPTAVREAASEDTACIVVNTPKNPTGGVLNADQMEALVRVAEDYDAVLVSDETYDHFDYSENFTSALSFDSEHRIVTSSFSKSMAITGVRVGYAIIPESLFDLVHSRHMLTNVAINRQGQSAVLKALRETGPDYYEESRDLLRERIAAFTDALDRAGAEYTDPDGAFYVMAKFEDFPGTMENSKRLIDEAGVAGMPGEAFGDARADWHRFAIVTPRAVEAADRLAEYFG
ncbi:MAG: aspartate aminotransferase [Halobacteriales archaeon]|jgi:aspartate aminotransferase